MGVRLEVGPAVDRKEVCALGAHDDPKAVANWIVNEVSPHFASGVGNYRKGEEMLVDMLLMSRTDLLLKGAAAGGELALWFNPELECIDFALESRFCEIDARYLTPAYRKLNVDEAGRVRRLCRRLSLRLKAQYFAGHPALLERLTEPALQNFRYCAEF